MWTRSLLMALSLGLAACGPGEETLEEQSLASVEQKAIQTVGPMRSARYQHCSAVLPDGKVLLVGGGNGSEDTVTTEVYDPVAKTTSFRASMNDKRRAPTCLLLRDGSLMAMGGTDVGYDSFAEKYTPSTNTWTLLPRPPISLWSYGMAAIQLDDGRVLVTGGVYAQSGSYLFDPSNNTWTTTGSLKLGRMRLALVKLPDNRVLAIGGYGQNGAEQSLEVYTPSTGTWSSLAPMLQSSRAPSAVLLPDGRVFVVGAVDPNPVLSGQVYDPSTNSWTLLPQADGVSASGAKVVLVNGQPVVVGGTTYPSEPQRIARFDVALRQWSILGQLSVNRDEYTLDVLPDGLMLIAGGINWHTQASYATLDLLTLDTPPSSDTSPLSYSATNTNSAQQNTINRALKLNAGDVLEVGTCNVTGSSASGDTYLRLLGGGSQVAYNDDSCGGTASYIQYTAATTGTYELRAGCFSSGSCSGTVAFRITPFKP